MMHGRGSIDSGNMKLGIYIVHMSFYIFQVLFGPSPECVIPGRTLFGGEGEEEEDILTEPPPEQLPSKFLLDHVR